MLDTLHGEGEAGVKLQDEPEEEGIKVNFGKEVTQRQARPYHRSGRKDYSKSVLRVSVCTNSFPIKMKAKE